MEHAEEPLSARPALETEGLRFLHVTVGSLLASYGWYILFSCIFLYIVIQKLAVRLRALRQRQLDQAEAVLEPDVVVKRQEALAAARLRMQEDLNAQVEKHKEKLRQVWVGMPDPLELELQLWVVMWLEEEKRRQKIEMWDSMQEGRSYRRNTGRPQEEDGPGPSTSSVTPKRKSDKKPLRGGGYNPLTGEGGGTCSWRPGRRGPSSGG
ncbi:selenoprotein S [Cricetulus griseus]|nr:selenoprotein S [Cricetulus griseus]